MGLGRSYYDGVHGEPGDDLGPEYEQFALADPAEVDELPWEDAEIPGAGAGQDEAGFASDDSLGPDLIHHEPVADGAFPQERVRFATPLYLQMEGSQEALAGTLVNLSVHGAACVFPVEATAADRVWISFRLSLGGEPVTFLCEVVWSERTAEREWAVGLRFLSLTREETLAINDAVRERAEGKAGEWPLPMMPQDEMPEISPPSRGPNPWVSAALGMVAGAGIALLLSMVPSVGVTQAAVAPTPAIDPAPAATTSPATAVAPSPGVRVVRERGPDGASVDPAVPAQAEPLATPEAPKAEEPAAVQLAPPPAKPNPAPLPKKMASSGSSGPGVLRPLGDAENLSLALLVDGRVDQHVSFWLSNPTRLVVDVPQSRSAFARNTYDIDHPLATRLRVGNHPDKVRYVLETAPGIKRQAEIAPRDGALVVQLRR